MADDCSEVTDELFNLNISDCDISFNGAVSTSTDTSNKSQQQEISVMSWNINGSCERALLERLDHVILEIKQINPTMVMLQEVVDKQMSVLKSELSSNYDMSFGDISAQHYNVLLITKQKDVNLETQKKSFTKFKVTESDCHYIEVDCKIYNRRFSLFASNLESAKQCSTERKKQLDEVVQLMRENEKESIAIFGGDMNLWDSEVRVYPRRSAPVSDIADVWVELGSDANTEHTLDMCVNKNCTADPPTKHRFNRLLIRKTPCLTPIAFTTLGKAIIPSCNMYPSSHWGILAYFHLV